MSSERVSAARRLEISEPVERDGEVTGRYAGVAVALEDHGDHSTVCFTLEGTVPWETLGLFSGREINDPDVVVTGDAKFDAAISVLAKDGLAPAVSAVLTNEGLRAQALHFFQQWPMATIRGPTLTLPDVPNEPKRLREALQAGGVLLKSVRGVMVHTPVQRLEAAPRIDPGPLLNSDQTNTAGIVAAILAASAAAFWVFLELDSKIQGAVFTGLLCVLFVGALILDFMKHR